MSFRVFLGSLLILLPRDSRFSKGLGPANVRIRGIQMSSRSLKLCIGDGVEFQDIRRASVGVIGFWAAGNRDDQKGTNPM